MMSSLIEFEIKKKLPQNKLSFDLCSLNNIQIQIQPKHAKCVLPTHNIDHISQSTSLGGGVEPKINNSEFLHFGSVKNRHGLVYYF